MWIGRPMPYSCHTVPILYRQVHPAISGPHRSGSMGFATKPYSYHTLSRLLPYRSHTLDRYGEGMARSMFKSLKSFTPILFILSRVIRFFFVFSRQNKKYGGERLQRLTHTPCHTLPISVMSMGQGRQQSG